jgi:hypothetical protein
MNRVVSLLFLICIFGLPALAQNWTPFDYYTQTNTYFTTVQQPINADGSSVYPAKKAGVVPVKFALSVGLGDLTIISASDGNAAHGDGGVQFVVPAGVTLDNMNNLRVTGTYPFPNCGAGSPRFTLFFADGGSVHVYLGNGGDPNTGCELYTGGNLLGDPSAIRFEIGNSGTYVNLAAAQTAHSGSDITSAIFVVDNGSAQATLHTAEIGTTTYTFASSTPTPTCTLPPATIDVQQVSGANPVTVDETLYTMAADNGNNFRINSCQYAYNLSTKQMTAGNYKVFANINAGGDVTTGGQFALK